MRAILRDLVHDDLGGALLRRRADDRVLLTVVLQAIGQALDLHGGSVLDVERDVHVGAGAHWRDFGRCDVGVLRLAELSRVGDRDGERFLERVACASDARSHVERAGLSWAAVDKEIGAGAKAGLGGGAQARGQALKLDDGVSRDVPRHYAARLDQAVLPVLLVLDRLDGWAVGEGDVGLDVLGRAISKGDGHRHLERSGFDAFAGGGIEGAVVGKREVPAGGRRKALLELPLDGGTDLVPGGGPEVALQLRLRLGGLTGRDDEVRERDVRTGRLGAWRFP